MTTKTSFTFDLGNRHLTADEVGVVKKAREALAASAARHGVQLDAGVLLKITSKLSATPSVIRPKTPKINQLDFGKRAAKAAK